MSELKKAVKHEFDDDTYCNLEKKTREQRKGQRQIRGLIDAIQTRILIRINQEYLEETFRSEMPRFQTKVKKKKPRITEEK